MQVVNLLLCTTIILESEEHATVHIGDMITSQTLFEYFHN